MNSVTCNIEIQHLKQEQPAIARFVLRNIKQRENESVEDFADKILQIAKLGYIRVSDQLLQIESIDAFVKGCTPRCTLYDRCRYPDTLAEVVRDVLREKVKSNKNEIKTEKSVEISNVIENKPSVEENSSNETKYVTSVEPNSYETETETLRNTTAALTNVKEASQYTTKTNPKIKKSTKPETPRKTTASLTNDSKANQYTNKTNPKIKASTKLGDANRIRKKVKCQSRKNEKSKRNSQSN